MIHGPGVVLYHDSAAWREGYDAFVDGLTCPENNESAQLGWRAASKDAAEFPVQFAIYRTSKGGATD